jgi:proteic killer suppression protein
MRVSFSSEKLQKVCESAKELQRAYGDNDAKKAMTRLSDLRAAATLADMRHLPGRCHELKGERKGQLAIDLTGGRRLVFEPSDGWPAEKQDGADAWPQIEAVRVLGIVDYH